LAWRNGGHGGGRRSDIQRRGCSFNAEPALLEFIDIERELDISGLAADAVILPEEKAGHGRAIGFASSHEEDIVLAGKAPLEEAKICFVQVNSFAEMAAEKTNRSAVGGGARARQ
jgi:hypothetical protein